MSNDEITFLDAKIEMFLDYMRRRKGKPRGTATPQELADRFRAELGEVTRIMTAAHSRGLVSTYITASGTLYWIRSRSLER